MCKKSLLLLVIFYVFNSNAQSKKKILFLGNSYTYYNNLPQLVADIALSKSDTVVYDQNTPGGYTFQNHCTSSITWQKIRSQKWDVVILQGQSQEPSFDPSQVISQTYPFAKQLCDSVRAANACTEIMFYMTWGRKNGDLSNCTTYSPVCTYNGMQARLRESYMMFKDSFMASVAPVGVAWKTYRNTFPLIDLYIADESHPSLHGSYLTACVFYSSIFKKTTVGSTYNPSLPVSDVANIQSISSQTVLDSVSVWNLGSNMPKADFTYSLTSSFACQFTNSSKNALSFQWSFGSNLKNPIYTFPGAGNYNVVLKATNQCSADSITKTISFTGINEFEMKNTFTINYSDHKIYLSPDNKNEYYSYALYASDGKLLSQEFNLQNDNAFYLNYLENGVFIVRVTSKNSTISKKIALME